MGEKMSKKRLPRWKTPRERGLFWYLIRFTAMMLFCLTRENERTKLIDRLMGRLVGALIFTFRIEGPQSLGVAFTFRKSNAAIARTSAFFSFYLFFFSWLKNAVVGTFFSVEKKVHKEKTILVKLSFNIFITKSPFRGLLVIHIVKDNLNKMNYRLEIELNYNILLRRIL